MNLGNAPCSWSVEFADDPRNPPWHAVLDECAFAGFAGIELDPVGFLPEDPSILREALASCGLALSNGVLFQTSHDESAWKKVADAHLPKPRIARGSKQLILIDSRTRTLGARSNRTVRPMPPSARSRWRAPTVTTLPASSFEQRVG